MTRFLIIAAMATALLIQSPLAQTVDQAATAQTEMDKALKGMGVKSQSGATDKVDATMTNPNSLPTENTRKAAAAMSR